MKKFFRSTISTLLSVALLVSGLTFGVRAASPSTDFVYTVDVIAGTATIIGYNGEGGKVDIPEKLGGATVTAISENAFYFKPLIESVTIPSGVETIGAGAFWGCSNLSKLQFNDKVKTIGNTAFFNTAITTLTLPESVTSIGERTFAQCKSLVSVTLSSRLSEIPESAFYDCEALRSVVIPDRITRIGREAFALCDSLSSVTIGKGVRVIETNAFHDCPCSGVVIPSTVTQLDSEAFGFNTNRDSYDTGLMKGFVIVGNTGTAAETYATDSGITFKQCAHSVSTVGGYTVPPTCTEGGEQVNICKDCYTFLGTEQVDKLGHDYKLIVHNPTCTEGGFDEHTCSRCGDSYTDNEKESLGTSHVFKETVINPTCDEEGYTIATCENCGYEERYDYVFPMGHDAYKLSTTDPTCDSDGYTLYHCNRCDKDLILDIVSALGHDLVQGDTHQPNCVDAGYTVYHCNRCQQDFNMDPVPAKGHSYVDSVVKPTCTANGYTKHTCSVCETEYLGDYVQALGHDISLSKVTLPTYTTKGSAYICCSRCEFEIEDPKYTTGYKPLEKPLGLKVVNQSTNSVKVQWKAVTGAQKYTVECVTNKKSVTTTALSYTFKSLKPGTTYKFSVRAVAGGNVGTSCTPVITATKPSKVTFSKASAVGGRKVALTWKKLSASDGYVIQYSTSSNFSSSKKVTVSKNSTVSKTITSLTRGKKYYFRVRAYKYGYGNKLYGSYSSVRSVVVK